MAETTQNHEDGISHTTLKIKCNFSQVLKGVPWNLANNFKISIEEQSAKNSNSILRSK